MTNTMRIVDNVEITLSEEFLTSDTPSDLGSPLYNSAMEECFGGIALTQFDELINKTMNSFKRYDASMDINMTVDLHKSLPLTRRQASDMRFWSWLGVIHVPDFVAWRWKPAGTPAKRSKVRFCGTDRVRQTFARLWWAAELTRKENDYTITAELLNHPGFQNNYEAIFGRAFGSYFPAMEAFVNIIKDKKERFIEILAIELGYALTTNVLESMDKNDLLTFMNNLAIKIE
ncbi:MAG: DUF6339 family protein [Gammaproteobacteria bacterium]|nr:DUF6339 family protein [Gammaproteobacteria bacterium]